MGEDERGKRGEGDTCIEEFLEGENREDGRKET